MLPARFGTQVDAAHISACRCVNGTLTFSRAPGRPSLRIWAYPPQQPATSDYVYADTEPVPRAARIVFPGVPHHVTQRGNNRRQVFLEPGDGLAYLQMLKEQARRHEVEIVAYCLMPNHVHLVLIPAEADGLHRSLKSVHGRYAMRVNRMHDLVGHLWQNRYFSSPLDSAYFIKAVRYVELNPVRAKLVRRAEDYKLSSAAAHCGLRDDPLVESRPRSTLFHGIADWSRWLAEGVAHEEVRALRERARRNLPCGSDEFVAGLEAVSGKPMRWRPRGRPIRECAEESGQRRAANRRRRRD